MGGRSLTNERVVRVEVRAATAETEESLRRERRSYFVGMTRAMRALLVVRPRETTNPLLEGFSPELWNVR